MRLGLVQRCPALCRRLLDSRSLCKALALVCSHALLVTLFVLVAILSVITLLAHALHLRSSALTQPRVVIVIVSVPLKVVSVEVTFVVGIAESSALLRSLFLASTGCPLLADVELQVVLSVDREGEFDLVFVRRQRLLLTPASTHTAQKSFTRNKESNNDPFRIFVRTYMTWDLSEGFTIILVATWPFSR